MGQSKQNRAFIGRLKEITGYVTQVVRPAGSGCAKVWGAVTQAGNTATLSPNPVGAQNSLAGVGGFCYNIFKSCG